MRGRVGKLRRQLQDEFDRFFIPREVILRANGAVRYYAVGKRQQVAVAAIGLGLFGWIIITTAGFVLSSIQLQYRAREARQIVATYGALYTEITETRERLARVARELQAHRTYMVDLARLGGASHAAAPDVTAPDIEELAAVNTVAAADAMLAETAAGNRLLADSVEALEAKLAAIAEARALDADDRTRLAGQLARTQDERDRARHRATELSGRLAALQQAHDDLKLADVRDLATQIALRAQVAALHMQIGGLEAGLNRSDRENGRLVNSIAAMRSGMATIAADRMALRAARDELTSQVGLLENRLMTVQSTQQTTVQKLAERTRLSLQEVEKTVAMTGLDVEKMLKAAAKAAGGVGGPYLESPSWLRSSEERAVLASIERLEGEVERWEHLQTVLHSLPLAAPLDSYVLESGFGMRKDPVNHRRGMHEGIDMSSDLGVEVMSTAPGTVTYAGWMGHYGRLVEIDHGLGIKTRYAHLKSIAVKVGETVDYRQGIGKLGSSGRSTGPHVHYEVRIGGKAIDPTKFLEAGKYVFKG